MSELTNERSRPPWSRTPATAGSQQTRDLIPTAAGFRRASEFERVYRANVAAVTSYFARRTHDPQLAADLTADTFVAAIQSFSGFDAAKGTPRSWLFGIARHVFAQHYANALRDRDAAAVLGGHRQLDTDEAAELLDRIDAEASGRSLLEGLASMSAVDREVIDLVHVAGLTPKEAAGAVGISHGALRIRLFRARNRLRELTNNDHTDTTT